MRTPYPYYDTVPSPQRTVRANNTKVGDVRPVDSMPLGKFMAELVIEPDAPGAWRTISIRLKDEYIGMIPPMEANKFYRFLARITASGFIPRVQAEIFKYGEEDNHKKLVLYLRTDEKMFKNEKKLVPKARSYDLPDTHGKRHPYLDRPKPSWWRRLLGK